MPQVKATNVATKEFSKSQRASPEAIASEHFVGYFFLSFCFPFCSLRRSFHFNFCSVHYFLPIVSSYAFTSASHLKAFISSIFSLKSSVLFFSLKSSVLFFLPFRSCQLVHFIVAVFLLQLFPSIRNFLPFASTLYNPVRYFFRFNSSLLFPIRRSFRFKSF